MIYPPQLILHHWIKLLCPCLSTLLYYLSGWICNTICRVRATPALLHFKLPATNKRELRHFFVRFSQRNIQKLTMHGCYNEYQKYNGMNHTACHSLPTKVYVSHDERSCQITMRTLRNLPSSRHHKRRRRQIRHTLFLPLAIAAGCFALIISINNSTVHGEPTLNQTYEEITFDSIAAKPENAVLLTQDFQYHLTSNDTESADAPWYLTLVNRLNPLGEASTESTLELVDVPGGERVDARIYDALMEMLDAANELEPIVVSGYRTAEKQQRLYDDKIKKYKRQGYSQSEAVALAQQWVAEPGTSEHQLGLAVDINGATYDIYLWLQENSYKYGFIFRYPGNKTHITGVAEEVWHYRYVGKEAAAEIHERGICLEEYLENA